VCINTVPASSEIDGLTSKIHAVVDRNGLPVRLAFRRDTIRNDPICFSPYLYPARSMIERFFKKIKRCRCVAARYDKLAAGYLAYIKLASIRLWLRTYESTL
jgi:transposase